MNSKDFPEVETPPPWADGGAWNGPVENDSSSTPTGKEGNSGNEPWWASSITAAELDKIVFPPLEYLAEQVLVKGGVTILAGPPKVGKSYLSYGLACGVAAGGLALGGLETSGHGHVLLISLDDTSRARAQRRLREVMRGAALPAALTLHTKKNLGVGGLAEENLRKYLKNRPDTRLIIIDTLEHLRPTGAGSDGAYSKDVKFLDYIRNVAEAYPSVTILVLTHTRKENKHDPDDPITAVSGTHGITGGTDGLLVLTGKRGAPRRKLDVVSRDGQDKGLVLKFTDHGLEVTDEDPNDPTLNMTPDDADVYRIVQEHTSGIAAKDVAALLPHVGSVGNRLLSLHERDFISRPTRGTYAP